MKKQYFDARTYGLRKNAACKTLARVLDVPFAVADATTLPKPSYVGEDVENILLKLIQAADYDIKRRKKALFTLTK